jgi:hypothetical protein
MINQCTNIFSDPLPHHAFRAIFDLGYFIQVKKSDFNISKDDGQSASEKAFNTCKYYC